MNTEAVTDALVRHMADETTCSFFDDRLACDTALYYPNGDSVVVHQWPGLDCGATGRPR